MSNVLVRQLRATGFQRNLHILRRPQYIGPRVLTRGVANTVSSKPGSENLAHAATNIKEELGNSAGDLAKVIASANPKDHNDIAGPNPIASTFVRVSGLPSILYSQTNPQFSLESRKTSLHRFLNLS